MCSSDLREPKIISSENGKEIPDFLNFISLHYPKWFGFHISSPQECIGYFVLGAPVTCKYSREDKTFFLTLFNQIAGHLRHLVTHET